ncbi:PREDICTED: zinc finger HIT domain-containing protein 3 isoform X2 [Tarenaya hassleriana]|uniref:zinc finger HIT domain-containing protein 3 isoform X2 n=1 Tax=Tarenaya hassleriana TaxID=28532 RepID=UPI00053C17A8|nr:PREDICTED: zinc finger HIT domain-containing protein 3 isoform X2 [Tarenaya hassleriana]
MRPQAARTCEICEKAQSRYKCPSCLAPYCSLSCFKKHKETPCAKPSSNEEKPAPLKEVPVERPVHVEEASQVVQKTQLEALASSSEVCEALKDESLQKLIRDIDSSSDPLLELDKAMGVEAFRVFTDKVLSHISS